MQIAQVLVNLLRNAIEAIAESKEGKRQIIVTGNVDDGFVEISVEDTGPGVDPSLELFTQFETTKRSGMGLGLSICRSIIEAGGGRMWHAKSSNNGARFHFTVPRAL